MTLLDSIDTRIARRLWLVPLLLAVIVYIPAPWGEAIYDDTTMLERQLPNFKTISDALVLTRDDILGMPGVYYRPVVVLSYMLDRSLYSGWPGPGGFHLSNVIFHVITTFFVWLLARRMLCRSQYGGIGALAAAAIFAVHPIHVETVSWISGRSDLLATLFTVPSVVAALRWRDHGSGWWLALGALCYLLALMSKEVAFAILLLVPASFLLMPDPGTPVTVPEGTVTKRATRGAFAWIAAGVAYLSVTAIYLMLKPNTGTGLAIEFASDIVSDLIRATGYYLIKVVIPWPQSGFVTWDLMPGLAVCSLLVLLAIGITGVGVRRWTKCREGLLLYVMLWFGAALAPSMVIAISPAIRNPVAERYLYLPSVAMALLTGMIIAMALAHRRIRTSATILILLMVVYGIGAFQRGLVWQTELSYWSNTAKASGSHPLPLNELGRLHYLQGDLTMALKYYRQALTNIGTLHSIDLGFDNLPALIYNNIGLIYRDQRNFGEAERNLIKARDLDPDWANPHYSLGIIYGVRAGAMVSSSGVSRADRDAMFDKSVEAYQIVLQLDPGFPMARWMLSGTLLGYGDVLEADGDAERAAETFQLSLDQVDQMISESPALRFEAAVQAQRNQAQLNLNRLNQSRPTS